jgi:hypothetical protein
LKPRRALVWRDIGVREVFSRETPSGRAAAREEACGAVSPFAAGYGVGAWLKIVAADTSAWHKLRAIPSVLAFIHFLRRLIRERRLALGNDLLSRLIEVQDDGDRLSADELLAMCFLLLVAGHETTVNLIGNGILALLEHPDPIERLRIEPQLVPRAVEEMLGFSGPLQMATERYTTTDVQVGSVRILAVLSSTWCCRRRIATRRRSRIPTALPSKESRTGTSRSATAFTTASVRRWRDWKVRSRFGCC